MRRASLLLLLLLWSALVTLAIPPSALASADVEAFVREGCPHCAKAEAFLVALGREQPRLVIVVRDVGREPAALARLKEIAKAQGSGDVRVPAVYVGGQLIVGYSPEANTDQLYPRRTGPSGRRRSGARDAGRRRERPTRATPRKDCPARRARRRRRDGPRSSR